MSAQVSSMPTVPFGSHRLSRLIVGANCINGGSHLSRFVNEQMLAYFTDEQIASHLDDCRAQGINTWQSGYGNLGFYARYQQENGKLNYITLTEYEDDVPQALLEELVASGAVGIAHHGEATDVLFKRGEIDRIKDFISRAHDTVGDSGVQIGVSTHMPAVIDYIESAGWDVDFYMTCVYERHRSREALKELLGYVPIPTPEVYLEEDPPRMYRMIQQTDKTCLAFKILGASRRCSTQEEVAAAFQFAFSNIKAKDAVVVGMFPKHVDQIALNIQHAMAACGLKTPERGES